MSGVALYIQEQNTTKCQLTLWEAHGENAVDDHKSEEILGDHPVDHDHKGSHELESPENIILLYLRKYQSLGKLTSISLKIFLKTFKSR